MKRSIALIPAVALTLAAGAAWAAPASPKCKPVTGHFEALVVPPGTGHCQPVPPRFFCTAGRVWGGIQGSYQFAMERTFPTGEEEGTSTFFFTGSSVIFLKSGDQLEGGDTGTIDLARGGFASLITFSGGTGAMAGATGQIRLRGLLTGETPAELATSGDYTGTLCTP